MSTPREQRAFPKPIDTEQALEEILPRLVGIGDDLALIGGVALAFYGIERYTKDVDLAVTEAQAAAAERAFADSDPLPLKIGGISVATRSGVRVDLIDHRFAYRTLFEEAIREAKRVGPIARMRTREVTVVPLTYLVAMKLAADRPQDEVDLQHLLSRPELDYPGARAIVERCLGQFAARRLDRLARAARRSDAPPDYEEPGRS